MRSLRPTWAPIGAGLLALLLPACGPAGSTACPAVGWGRTIEVELTDDWPASPVNAVRIECSPGCPPLPALDQETGDPAASDAFGRGIPFGAPVPETAVVTVLAADGAALAEVAADLDWVRVGGSEECGGPMVATVAVPAP